MPVVHDAKDVTERINHGRGDEPRPAFDWLLELAERYTSGH